MIEKFYDHFLWKLHDESLLSEMLHFCSKLASPLTYHAWLRFKDIILQIFSMNKNWDYVQAITPLETQESD